MEGRLGAGVLWLRAALVAFVAFFLGVAGHVSADGLLPGPWALGVLFALAVVLCVPLVKAQVRLPRMVLLLVGGQTGVHLALSATGGHHGDEPAVAAPVVAPPTPALPEVDGARVGSLMDAYRAGSVGPDLDASMSLPVGHLIEDALAHAPMMAVHLVAAVLAALWLAHGERLLWNLMSLLGERLVSAFTRALVVPTWLRPAPIALSEVAPLWSRWLRQPNSRRGPPLFA
ncbi:hypothetical protein [Nocardioides sp.]|uniref:hypothetical protein n=1 Tax=Nocardioides sp. TaxID=35761 RepID=UPI00356763B5